MIKMNECVPSQQTTTRYHGMGLVNKHRIIAYMSESRINQSCMTSQSIDQSIDHKNIYVGPPPKPDLYCMNQFQ